MNRHRILVTSPFLTAAPPAARNESYFIAVPQVKALVNLTSWMRLEAGVGYRPIGGADLLDDALRGISGSIVLQFGGR